DAVLRRVASRPAPLRGTIWITKPIAPDPREAANRCSICVMALPYAHDIDITIRVNGRAVRAVVHPRTTLLDWLREEVGLTGTQKGCNEGACGTCTVLVDGARMNGCLTLAVQCDGREVTTVEGLADGD